MKNLGNMGDEMKQTDNNDPNEYTKEGFLIEYSFRTLKTIPGSGIATLD